VAAIVDVPPAALEMSMLQRELVVVPPVMVQAVDDRVGVVAPTSVVVKVTMPAGS
jgi:hypothetical protein